MKPQTTGRNSARSLAAVRVCSKVNVLWYQGQLDIIKEFEELMHAVIHKLHQLTRGRPSALPQSRHFLAKSVASCGAFANVPGSGRWSIFILERLHAFEESLRVRGLGLLFPG